MWQEHPQRQGCMRSLIEDPREHQKKEKRMGNNAFGRTRAVSVGRAGRVASAVVYAIERIDASMPQRGTSGLSSTDRRRRISAYSCSFAFATRALAP